jgi:hypothetical protein
MPSRRALTAVNLYYSHILLWSISERNLIHLYKQFVQTPHTMMVCLYGLRLESLSSFYPPGWEKYVVAASAACRTSLHTLALPISWLEAPDAHYLHSQLVGLLTLPRHWRLPTRLTLLTYSQSISWHTDNITQSQRTYYTLIHLPWLHITLQNSLTNILSVSTTHSLFLLIQTWHNRFIQTTRSYPLNQISNHFIPVRRPIEQVPFSTHDIGQYWSECKACSLLSEDVDSDTEKRKRKKSEYQAWLTDALRPIWRIRKPTEDSTGLAATTSHMSKMNQSRANGSI